MSTNLVDSLDPESNLSILVLAEGNFPNALADLGLPQADIIARDGSHLALASWRESLSNLVVLERSSHNALIHPYFNSLSSAINLCI